jgi:hypothetical protein
VRNLEIESIHIEKLDIAVAGLKPNPKKYISKGIIIILLQSLIFFYLMKLLLDILSKKLQN